MVLIWKLNKAFSSILIGNNILDGIQHGESSRGRGSTHLIYSNNAHVPS